MKLLNLFESLRPSCDLCKGPVAPTSAARSKKAGLPGLACGECIAWAKEQAQQKPDVPKERQETIRTLTNRHSGINETKWGWAQRGEQPPKPTKKDPEEEARKKAEYEKYKKEKLDQLEKEYKLRSRYGVGSDPVGENERLADRLLAQQREAEKRRKTPTEILPPKKDFSDLESKPTRAQTQKMQRRKFFPED